MPRRRPDDKFPQILHGAADVFIEHGYRRTQMADIAASLGIAKGTLYLYVASKEALFDAALRYVDAPPAGETPDLPVPTPKPEDTIAYVRGELARYAQLPSLMTALSQSAPAATPAAELSGILSDLYDVLVANRRRLKLLDRSARDYPEIAALWFDGARGGLLGLLEAYLENRMASGHFARSGSARVAARLLLETTVFWAVHRHWDVPSGLENEQPDEAEARSTVLALLTRALVQEKPS